jgi:heterodisulfide reductase subunit C
MKSPAIFDEALLYECYECARCTGSCPAAFAVEGFNPRNFLLTCLRLGLDAVVSDEKLWCCTTCHVCEDRCPQMLDVTDLLMALMNEAAKRGHIPDKVKAGTGMILHTGRVLLVSKRVSEMREKFGLEPLPEIPVEEVEGILEKTGLAGLLG